MYDLLKSKFQNTGKFTKEEIDSLVRQFGLVKTAKSDMLVREGDICSNIFFINRGMIRTFVEKDGDEVTTWIALPGTIETSAKSFITGKPSEVNLQTIDNCELLILTRDRYYDLLNTNPKFALFANKLLEEFYLRIEDKFFSYLFLSARERFERMRTLYPEHFKQVPLKYLASILRIKPETLSRLRKTVR